MTDEENMRQIKKNTDDIETAETNLQELSEGGRERWTHIRQSERDIQDLKDDDRQGIQGIQGARGEKGRSLTFRQAAAMFFLIFVIGLGLSYTLQRQQNKIERQQQEIAANTFALQRYNYDNCLASVKTVLNFNKQQEALADIERSLVNDPNSSPVGVRVGNARIKVYEANQIDLPPGDKPCGDPPR